MILRARGLSNVVNPYCQTDHGKEAQAGGHLQLTVAPADGEQLAASGQTEEEQDAQHGEGDLYMYVQPSRQRKAAHAWTTGEWPDRRSGQSEEHSDCNPGPTRQGTADRPQHGPGQFDQDGKLEERIDD